MTRQTDSEAQKNIEAQLRSSGLPLDVDVRDGVVTLSGIVLSTEEHEAALDLIDYVAGVHDVVDNLEIVALEEDQPEILFIPVTEADDATNDPMQAAAEGLPYFPPIDPPVEPGRGPDDVAVADGFASSSLEGDLDTDEEGYIYQDADLVDVIVRELADDSATSHLNLYVSSLGGLVVLSGTVPDETDADEAVEVAERVEGVEQVVNRLVVSPPAPATPQAQTIKYQPSPMSHVITPSASWRATVIANQFRLKDRRETVVEEIQHMERDLASYGVDQADEGHGASHNADLASDVQAAETLVVEINALKEELEEIDDALKAAREGRYGIDVDTGELIDPARLRAYPLARRTLRSQERHELLSGE